MLEFKKMGKEHIDMVAEIEKDNFTMPWSKNSFLEAVEDKSAIYIVALEDSKVVGYAGMWTAVDEADITNVAVKQDKRNAGIGFKVMDYLFSCGRNAGIMRFFLEVRKSNEAAIALYTKCGFRSVGIRKNFYEKPVEDAIIMTKI